MDCGNLQVAIPLTLGTARCISLFSGYPRTLNTCWTRVTKRTSARLCSAGVNTVDLGSICLMAPFRRELATFAQSNTRRSSSKHLDSLSIRDPIDVTLPRRAKELYEGYIAGASTDLEEVIRLLRKLLSEWGKDHPERASYLGYLANCLQHRFDLQRTPTDLDEAASHLRAALELCPVGHPARATFLLDLANCLRTRFKSQHSTADLEEAIFYHQASLELRPVGHPSRSSSLYNLAYSLQCRFQSQETTADLTEAISYHQAALELRPVGHPNRSLSLENLAYCLARRSDIQHTAADLEQAIFHLQAASELRSVGPLNRYSILNSLAYCLGCRSVIQSSMADLDKAISHLEAASKLLPLDHPNLSSSLDNLAYCLARRFASQNTPSDLDEAISHLRIVKKHRPTDLLDQPITLNNLAHCLGRRFDSQNTAVDLEEAISYHRTILERRLTGHPDQSAPFYNLAYRLVCRFLSQKTAPDLDEAVSHHRTALELRPTDHPGRSSSLYHLGYCLEHRFKLYHTCTDLDEAISQHRAALELRPLGHPDRSISLDSLASCLQSRFVSKRVATDLDEAVSYHRAALDLRFVGHPQRLDSLRNLANCLESRFDLRHIVADLSEAIVHRRAVLEGHSSKQPEDLMYLADSLEARFNYLATFADFEEALRIRQELPDFHFPSSPIASQAADNFPPQAAADNLLHVRRVVMDVVQEILKPFPPRLVNTHSGMLCDREAQSSSFQDTREYRELLESLSTHKVIRQPDIDHARATVANYFRYATLSHRWGIDEPLLHRVEGHNIYNPSNEMPQTVGLEKLQKFCCVAKDRSYIWAWSDTCCIDKTSSAELQEAIGSMFSWYQRSAVTIVHLVDVFDVADSNMLSGSIWFRRGWTLQELLAPPSLLFYTHDWSPCAASTSSNHKEDPVIVQVLERSTGIPPRYLNDFFPSVDDARSRLEWASARLTTRSEDIAYSLFGIFGLNLPVLYGEGEEKALARLLREIISESGETSVVDWVGRASSYHSCFPAGIVAYRPARTMQWTQRYIDLEPDFESSMSKARQLVTVEDARKLYDMVAGLPFPQFAHRRLSLPCIIHPIQGIKYRQRAINDYVYDIQAVGLRPLTILSSIKLKDGLQTTSFPYILAHVWDRNLLRQTLEEDEVTAAYRIIAQLGQLRGALLLEAQPRREYRRIASSNVIFTQAESPVSIARSEFKTLSIV